MIAYLFIGVYFIFMEYYISKKELEIIKASNQVKEDFIRFVWHNMPQKERDRIKKCANKKKKKLVSGLMANS